MRGCVHCHTSFLLLRPIARPTYSLLCVFPGGAAAATGKAAQAAVKAGGVADHEARQILALPNKAARAKLTEEEIVEIVSVISLFGFLNRWNDTMATPLEEEPVEFAQRTLKDTNWDGAKHMAGEAAE